MRAPKPGSMDGALWMAFVAGVAWEAGGPECIPSRDPDPEILKAFHAWRAQQIDPNALPQAEEPVPFPWDER